VVWLQMATGHSAPATAGVGLPQGSSARAILSEIRSCAERLILRGEPSAIDLRCLKSMPEERAVLARLLGNGEVTAVVGLLGRSEIRETGISCVWWVRHLDTALETVGELIEIADVPDLLLGDRTALARGLEALQA
jgi:hypothetical protein